MKNVYAYGWSFYPHFFLSLVTFLAKQMKGVFIWSDLDRDKGQSLRSCCVKETDESTLVTDSSVPLMHHDQSYIGFPILIHITKRTHSNSPCNFYIHIFFKTEYLR